MGVCLICYTTVPQLQIVIGSMGMKGILDLLIYHKNQPKMYVNISSYMFFLRLSLTFCCILILRMREYQLE